MEKRRILIDYQKLPSSLRTKLKDDYPNGYQSAWRRTEIPNKNESFMTIGLDTEEAFYLVKFKNRKRLVHDIEEEDDDASFNDEVGDYDDDE